MWLSVASGTVMDSISLSILTDTISLLPFSSTSLQALALILTEIVLVKVTNYIPIADLMDKFSVLTLLELTAAFDSVNHSFLNETLSSPGLQDTTPSWFSHLSSFYIS